MIDIKKLSEQDLKQKIENIKAEREKTADALKRYEEELERRNNQNWLPINNDVYFDVNFNRSDFDELCVETTMRAGFVNRDCFKKYLEHLTDIHKAWSSNAKGEPIDIKVLLPLLPKGWVAMEEAGNWCWFSFTNKKPEIRSGYWMSCDCEEDLDAFNIKPAENWEDSLMECGL